MLSCETCGSKEFSETFLDEIFQVEGRPVLVERIPAKVCVQRGEATFSRETTERIRQMLHGEHQPIRSINVDVYAFQAS
ncbi:MAG: YgiT-type zinc finger protein [Phormidium tanganyikae FI6-MK23]|jgi:YgiT-type zinc finger domain-containing protein|nr:YgiT-type zinc finger protein [Phormidium tanganyikae FI6-MK23]